LRKKEENMEMGDARRGAKAVRRVEVESYSGNIRPQSPDNIYPVQSAVDYAYLEFQCMIREGGGREESQ